MEVARRLRRRRCVLPPYTTARDENSHVSTEMERSRDCVVKLDDL